jgi:MscS family membrane protein
MTISFAASARAFPTFVNRPPAARADRVPTARVPRRLSCLAGAALLLLTIGTPLRAQLGFLRPSSASPASDSLATSAGHMSPESPRASATTFLELGKRHAYGQAAQYLDLSDVDSLRGPELARRLRDVLDQRLWISMEQVSPLAEGDTTDGDLLRDRLGVIPGVSGLPEPVMLRRVQEGRIGRWVFDAETVAQVDAWYESLPDAWLRGRIPSPLLREGPLGVHYWQWFGMLVSVALSVLLAAVIALGARWLLAMLTARTETAWDDLIVDRLRGPFRLWLVGVLATPLFGVLGLNARVAGLVSASARGVVLVALFWGVLRVISLVQEQLLAGPWAAGQPQARTLVPLLARILRVSVGIIALLVVLSQFGYSVGALLTGVGIGGVALALASQKTVEHLFGSVSLAADKVFRVGDFVRLGDMEGTVERIGLRSTSVRTLARTVVRIPNGRLAEERIETFGERDRFFFGHDLGVVYSTTPAQLRLIVERIEARLREEPALWTESTIVRVVAFADSAITIRVRAWFQVPDFPAFLEVQHELLLSFIEIVEGAGSSFAFPSRTVYHVQPGDGEDAGRRSVTVTD